MFASQEEFYLAPAMSRSTLYVPITAIAHRQLGRERRATRIDFEREKTTGLEHAGSVAYERGDHRHSILSGV